MKDRHTDPLAPTPEVVRKRPTRESLAQPATLTAGLAMVAALYFARDILIPITLALIFSFLVAPLVRLLQRLHINQAIAVMVSVVVPLCVVVTIAGVVGSQVAELAQSLPQYQETIDAKVASIQAFANGRVGQFLGRAGQVIERVTSGQTPSPPTAAPPQAAPAHGAHTVVPPAPVVVVPSETRGPPIQLVGHFLSVLLGPVETAAIVFILSIFMLIERETVRDRFIKLTGARDSVRTTIALDDTAERLSRYFLSQLGVNTSVGIVIGCGLAAMGTPSPVLWGVLAATLRFIPYVGVWIAAVLAGLLAAAIDPGWSMVFWTLGLFGITEMIASQFVEPLLYGHTTGLSPLSVVVAAIFWSWLWGPVGLILSTPLTLCLVVLGRYVERLNFLEILLGERPNVRTSQELFERLTAGNADAAIKSAEQFLAKNSGADYLDQALIPALRLLSESTFNDVLVPAAVASATEASKKLIAQLPQVLAHAKGARAKRPLPVRTSVECISGSGPIDSLLTEVISVLLRQQGFEVIAPGTVVSPSESGAPAAAICVLSVEPMRAETGVREIITRHLAQRPAPHLVSGIYTVDEIKQDLQPFAAPLLRASSAKQVLDRLRRRYGGAA